MLFYSIFPSLFITANPAFNSFNEFVGAKMSIKAQIATVIKTTYTRF